MPTVRKPPARKPVARATPRPSPQLAAKRPAHRPAYQPTEKDRLTVTVMVAGGIEQPAIAGVLGITPKTLRKHFRREIDTGAPSMHARVVASLFTMATTGKNVHAAKWITQALMGWSERVVVADGGVDDAATLTDADIEARITRLRRSPAALRAARVSDTTH